MKKRLIEGYWDCKFCGTKKISGGVRECPNCGKPRDEDTTFYLSGEHKYVAPKTADTINRNPDWVCNFCNNLNSDSDIYCRSCGAPRTSENLNYFENKKKQQEESKTMEFSEAEVSNVSDRYSLEKQKIISLISLQFYKKILKHGLIGLFSVLTIIGLIYLFIPKNKEITISQMSWERSIDIERYQTVEESDWNLPPTARLLYSQREISHYEQVLDHYETKTRQVRKERISGYEEYVVGTKDLGNGYFEEITDERPIYETYYEDETYEEPVYRNQAVYRTKYYYEIDKWLYERTEASSGYDKEPYWCEITLATDERVSSRNEAYYVTGTDKNGKTQRYSMSYEDWNHVEVEQTVKLKVSTFGDATLVE